MFMRRLYIRDNTMNCDTMNHNDAHNIISTALSDDWMVDHALSDCSMLFTHRTFSWADNSDMYKKNCIINCIVCVCIIYSYAIM